MERRAEVDGQGRGGRQGLRLLIFLAVLVVQVFGCAGTLAWAQGWAFVAITVGAAASVSLGVFRRWPELAQERRTAAASAKPWDRTLVPWVVGLPVLGVTLAALGRRLGWATPFPGWTAWPAAAAMILGSALAWAAMRENRFFSSHVRIQAERGHAVVRAGPYAHLRHPGYAGSILFTLGTPVLLDSAAGFAVAVVVVALTVLRTALEDQTLQRELPGYAQYAGAVRWRLLPGAW